MIIQELQIYCRRNKICQLPLFLLKLLRYWYKVRAAPFPDTWQREVRLADRTQNILACELKYDTSIWGALRTGGKSHRATGT